MYFPVFKGQQYELLALRDLADPMASSGNVLPVIEPMVPSGNTATALGVFVAATMPFCLIVNPKVGELSTLSIGDFKTQVVDPNLGEYDNYIPTLYVDGTTGANEVADFIAAYDGDRAFFFLHDPNPTVLAAIVATEKRYALFRSGAISAATKNKFPAAISVDITDSFHRRTRNVDYPDDEFFLESTRDSTRW